MTETIDLTPRGMQTPEGVKRVNARVKQFEDATLALANLASDFFDDHQMTILELARGNTVGSNDRQALCEALHQLAALVGSRRREQDELLRAVAGVPAVAHVQELTQFQYSEDSNGPWALYIFGDDGLHSGRQYFAKVPEFLDEQLPVEAALRLATEAIAQKKEVRVCDCGDRLVFHSKDGYTTYGQGFWEQIR